MKTEEQPVEKLIKEKVREAHQELLGGWMEANLDSMQMEKFLNRAFKEIENAAKAEEREKILKAMEEASVWDTEYLYTRKARLIEFIKSL